MHVHRLPWRLTVKCRMGAVIDWLQIQCKRTEHYNALYIYHPTYIMLCIQFYSQCWHRKTWGWGGGGTDTVARYRNNMQFWWSAFSSCKALNGFRTHLDVMKSASWCKRHSAVTGNELRGNYSNGSVVKPRGWFGFTKSSSSSFFFFSSFSRAKFDMAPVLTKTPMTSLKALTWKKPAKEKKKKVPY